MSKRAGLRPFLKTILSNWEQWLSAAPINLTFRILQLLTGHGCFTTYLTKIGATQNKMCGECGLKEDDAEHSLFECISFEMQREKMRSVIGNDLTCDTIILATAQAGEKSLAIQEFSEEIIKQKEDRD